MTRRVADERWQQLGTECARLPELYGSERRTVALAIALDAMELTAWAGIETATHKAPPDS